MQIKFDVHADQADALETYVDEHGYESRAQFMRELIAEIVGVDGDGNRVWRHGQQPKRRVRTQRGDG